MVMFAVCWRCAAAAVTHPEDMTEPEPGTRPLHHHTTGVWRLLPGRHKLGLIPRAQHIGGHGDSDTTFIVAAMDNCTGGLVMKVVHQAG